MNRLAIVAALLVGVVVGCVATLARQRRLLTVPAPSTRVKVLAAVKNIPAGTRIHRPEDFFELRSFAPDSVPDSVIDDYGQITYKITTRGLRAGTIVTTDDFGFGMGPQPTLLPPGFRAVAISVSKVDSDLIKPGSRVDLICTKTDPQTQIRTPKLFAQNVLVLAVSELAETPEEKKSLQPRTRTFALSAEDGARLLAASTDSVVSVSLRRSDDPTTLEPKGATGPFPE